MSGVLRWVARACALMGVMFAHEAFAAPDTVDPTLFTRQSKQVENTFRSIEDLTAFIAQLGAAAANQGQQLKKSCIDEIYVGAAANLSAARKVRSTIGDAKGNADFADRILQRMMRLQVYAMVFDQEARSCKDMSDASAAIREALAQPAPIANPYGTPPPPRLERPPLASPY